MTNESFYYRSSDKEYTVYSIRIKSLKLVKSMEEIYKKNNIDYCSIKNPYIFERFKHSINDNIIFNSEKFIKIVNDYIKIWEDKVEEADYVKVTPIKTYYKNHILKNNDIELIESYLNIELTTELHNEKLEDNELLKFKIKVLSELIIQVNHIIIIPSLTNKIYAYIAILLYSKSITDLLTN
jgi:hypothetical protein